MKEESYRQALSFFNNGDYEKALNILKREENQISSTQERQLFEQCKKQITEQYYYLINDSIRQEDYLNANALKNEYKVKYGDNPRIANIVVPKKEASTSFQHSADPEMDEDESSTRSLWLWLIIGGIVVIGFIGFLYWQYNNDNDVIDSNPNNTVSMQDETKPENYEEKSEAIISRLTGEYGDQIKVLNKYPELSKYCAFSLTENETEYLLIYDLEQEVLKRFDLHNLSIVNGENVLLFEFNLSMNHDNNKILITGNNGAYSIGYLGFTEYILELDTYSWSIREICSGNEITKKENGYVAHKGEITRWNDDVRNSEYAIVDVFYDLNGNLIPSPLKGEPYQFKGKIDNRYAVTMQLSIWNDKIYGEYYYDRNGSENVLYLYGGISSGRDIVLLEFNDNGEQTSTFKGRFGRDSFSGTFVNYQNKEMPFELYLGDNVSNGQQTENNDYQSSELMPDRDAEFPGGMIGLGEYITENMQYPVIAQENGVSGNVRVSYIIDESGNVTDAEVIESVDPYLDREAVRLISSMPKWKPGVRNGKYVKMKTSTVIRFELK